MDRAMLRGDQWERIEHVLPGKKNDPGYTAKGAGWGQSPGFAPTPSLS